MCDEGCGRVCVCVYTRVFLSLSALLMWVYVYVCRTNLNECIDNISANPFFRWQIHFVCTLHIHITLLASSSSSLCFFFAGTQENYMVWSNHRCISIRCHFHCGNGISFAINVFCCYCYCCFCLLISASTLAHGKNIDIFSSAKWKTWYCTQYIYILRWLSGMGPDVSFFHSLGFDVRSNSTCWEKKGVRTETKGKENQTKTQKFTVLC